MKLELKPSYIEYDLSSSDRIKVIFQEPDVQKLHRAVSVSVVLNPALADLLIKELTRFCVGAGHPRWQLKGPESSR